MFLWDVLCDMCFWGMFFCNMFFWDMFFWDMLFWDICFWNIGQVLNAFKRMHLCFCDIAVFVVVHKWRLVLVVELHDFLICGLTRPTTLSQYPTTDDRHGQNKHRTCRKR